MRSLIAQSIISLLGIDYHAAVKYVNWAIYPHRVQPACQSLTAEIIAVAIRYKNGMIIRIGSKPADAPRVKFVKGFYLGGSFIQLRQIVTWAAAPMGNRIQTSLETKRLCLTAFDYNGAPLHFGHELAELALQNDGLEQLQMPKEFICPAARAWLEKFDGRLALIIERGAISYRLPSNIFNLYAGINPVSRKVCGQLVIGALS